MSTDESSLRRILAVGHDTSMRGEGLSLRDALARVRYGELRMSFDQEDLLRLIRTDPNLVLQWIQYSEDKRTDGGWYIIEETREIARPRQPETKRRFSSIEEAVAEYVVRELDFWWQLRAPTA
jgi:hypothetical protein